MATYQTQSFPCTGVVPSTAGLWTKGHEFAGRVIFDATTNNVTNQTVISSWRFEIFIRRPEYETGYTATSSNAVEVKFGNSVVFSSANVGTVSMANHYESTSTKPGSLGPLVLARGTTLPNGDPITIQHDDNGNGSVSVVATYSKNLAYMQNITVNETIAFPKVPRSAAIDSVTNVDFGGYPTVKWTPANTNYWYKVSYTFGNNTVTSAVLKPSSTSQYSYNSLQIPTTWVQSTPNSRTATVTAKLETFSDSGATTSIGSNTKTFTVTVPDTSTYQPTATLTLTEVDAYVVQLLQTVTYCIQGKTSFEYTLGNGTKYGATLQSYNLVATDSSENVVYSYSGTTTTGVVPVFNVAGTATFTLTVIDSRGLSGTTTLTRTITAYSKPTIRASATRGTGTVSDGQCSNFVVDEAEGTVVRITYTITYTALSLNLLVVNVEKPDGTTQIAPAPANGGTENVYFASYSVDNSYEFTVIANDRVSNQADASRAVVLVAPAHFPIDVSADGNSIAFHGVAQYRSGDGSAQFYQDVEIFKSKILKFYDDNGNVRATLDIVNGLVFYSASGSVIGSYPVNGSGGSG